MTELSGLSTDSVFGNVTIKKFSTSSGQTEHNVCQVKSETCQDKDSRLESGTVSHAL